jgi:hypothetical protein
MNRQELENFIIKARTKTYAGDGGKVTPSLDGSTQLEFVECDFKYQDVYFTGKNTFYGMETVYHKNKPIWGMSYYGNWGEMTEKEIDEILRGALMSNPGTRLYKKVSWEKDDFLYECTPESTENINEIGGAETIHKNSEQIYVFYYAGSTLI